MEVTAYWYVFPTMSLGLHQIEHGKYFCLVHVPIYLRQSFAVPWSHQPPQMTSWN